MCSFPLFHTHSTHLFHTHNTQASYLCFRPFSFFFLLLLFLFLLPLCFFYLFIFLLPRTHSNLPSRSPSPSLTTLPALVHVNSDKRTWSRWSKRIVTRSRNLLLPSPSSTTVPGLVLLVVVVVLLPERGPGERGIGGGRMRVVIGIIGFQFVHTAWLTWSKFS